MTSAHQRAAQMLAAAADLLDQGQILNRLSIAVTAIAIAILLLPMIPASEATLPTAAAVAVFGFAELMIAMRVGLDAALFRRLGNDAAGERLDVAAFDAAMLALKLMSAGKAGQPIAKRFAGARRLLIVQGAALFLQIAAAVAGGAAIYFNWA
jgi:hypothetical protein